MIASIRNNYNKILPIENSSGKGYNEANIFLFFICN